MSGLVGVEKLVCSCTYFLRLLCIYIIRRSRCVMLGGCVGLYLLGMQAEGGKRNLV